MCGWGCGRCGAVYSCGSFVGLCGCVGDVVGGGCVLGCMGGCGFECSLVWAIVWQCCLLAWCVTVCVWVLVRGYVCTDEYLGKRVEVCVSCIGFIGFGGFVWIEGVDVWCMYG